MAGRESHLVTARFRECVRLARPEASDPEIVQALRHARIWDCVSGLSGGLATLVGEQGRELSGSRRQRIVRARGLLATAPVLVRGEPVTHPDSGTAKELIAILSAAARDQSVLLTTHRTEGFELVDRVVSLAPPRTPNSICQASTG